MDEIDAGKARMVRERPGRVRWRQLKGYKAGVRVLEQEWIVEEYIDAIPPHRGGGWGPSRSDWREVPTEGGK